MTAVLGGTLLQAPAPAQGAAAFTVTSASIATGGTATVVMLGSNKTPVMVSGAARGSAPVMVSATAIPAPGPAAALTRLGAPVPVTTPAPAAASVTAPATTPATTAPLLTAPRTPPGLPAAVSNALAANLAALTGAGSPAGAVTDSNAVQLNFRDAPLDQLLNMYGDLTGRTIRRCLDLLGIRALDRM